MRTLYFCPAVFFYLLSFFLACSQPLQIGCLPYFHTWCGLSANLGSGLKRAARGSLKIQDAKNCHLCTMAQFCRAVSLQLRHVSTTTTHTTTTVLRPFFRDHPGEPVPEENLRTLWRKGRLTVADTPTIRVDAIVSRLGSVHLHHPPTYRQSEKSC